MKKEKALAAIQAQLRPGEKMIATAGASLRQLDAKGKQGPILSGAIGVSDQRVLFTGGQLMEKQTFAIPLSAISSVDQHRQALMNYTMITVHGGVQHRFLQLHETVLTHIENARAAAAAPAPRPAPSPAPAAQPGTAEQIAQLAELHKAGALSDAEFTAAKARLLGI